MNKKAYFFIMLTVVILSLFLISTTVLSGYAARKSIQERVSSVTDFVVNIEEDLPRKLFVFGYRAVYLAEKEIVSSDGYINNFTEFFEEAFFDETINGGTSLEIQEVLEDSTYDDIIDDLNEKGSRLGVTMNFSNPYIYVTQDDPWNLKIIFTADFTASDINGLVTWNKSMSVVEYVRITNFTDPFYVKGTGGLYNQRILQTNYSNPFSEAELLNQLNEGYYLAVPNEGPSFIDRLEGNYFATNPYGIESLVNANLESIDYVPKSMIDHQYFSSANPLTCQVNGMPSWFEVDSSRLNPTYGLNCI